MNLSDLSGLKSGVSVLRSDHDLFVFHDTSDRTGFRVARFGTTDFLNISARAVRIVGELGADGWISWAGGESPVGEMEVEVRYRNGETEKRDARRFGWTHWHSDEAPHLGHFDIIAFRPVQTVRGHGSLQPSASIPTEQADKPVVGVKRTLEGETVLGFRVAAWRYHGPNDSAFLDGHRYCAHWSTPGEGARNVERLFTETQLREVVARAERLEGSVRTALAWLETVERLTLCRDTQTGAMGLQTTLRTALSEKVSA